MACSAKAQPNLTPVDRARYVTEHLTPHLFRSVAPTDTETNVAWRISPQPFPLSPATVKAIASFGSHFLKFYRALNTLYFRSVRGTAPDFIREYLDLGKPDQIIRIQRQNRLKQDVPGVIRPDIILTEDGMAVTELDSVPGGMGFVGSMGEVYCELGYDQVGEYDGILRGFAAMCRDLAGKEKPVVAIVVSEESSPYRTEMDWLAGALRSQDLLEAVAIHPEEIVFTEEALVVDTPSGRRKVDVVYRFFELFDMLNVPKHELMLYAARHRRAVLTPPPKAFLEEKSSFALLHHPALESYWKPELGEETYALLLRLFPQTWILDPQPLPPQGAIAGLFVDNRPLQNWNQLYGLSKSERQFVVKPSGFSELAWGARGVYVANDLTRNEWMAVIDGALAIFEKNPQVLQRFHKGKRVKIDYLDTKNNAVVPMEGRVRLTPFYFVERDEAKLSGILATIAPADKRIIHGMSDAVMNVCMESPSGY